jgi:DNA replication protein DnaC
MRDEDVSPAALNSLFERLQSAVRRKEHESPNSPLNARLGLSEMPKSKTRNEPCLCAGTGGVYITLNNSSQAKKRVFQVCPACNPRHHCHKCEGTGHARKFNLHSQTEDVIPYGCSCVELETSVQNLNEAQLPERYFQSDFEKLSYHHLPEGQRDKLQSLAGALEEYCEITARVWKEDASLLTHPFATLMGPVGTGKTHMAVAVFKRFVLKFGMTGRFVDFSRFLGELRNCYSQKNSEETILEPLRKVDVLLLDELGKGRTENEWQLEKLDDLINSRYNSGRITLLTTNYLSGGEYRYDPKRYGMREVPANESFWKQTLQERIGARMYDRLLEASKFFVFLGLDSYRRRYLDSLREEAHRENIR